MQNMKNLKYKTTLVALMILTLSLASLANQGLPLTPNDVSILMPLPKDLVDAKNHIYLNPEDTGGIEKIWPMDADTADAIMSTFFSTSPGPAAKQTRNMLVTAFRFDPCFPELNWKQPGKCEAQVRLTVQLYSAARLPKELFFEEIALHLFYSLTPQQAKDVVKDLKNLKAASPIPTEDQALFVHPAFAANAGMSSAWGQQLKTMILKYVSVKNLFRATATGFSFDNWPFRAWQIEDGKIKEKEQLKHLNETSESQSLNMAGSMYPAPDLNPKTEQGANALLSPLYNTGVVKLPEGQKLQDAIDSVARIRNPKRHSPDSTDCVSCHLSQIVYSKFVALGLDWTPFEAYRPKNSKYGVNKTNPEIQKSAANVVQFGYFLRNAPNEGLPLTNGVRLPIPSVSDRVIFESIEVSDFVNKNF